MQTFSTNHQTETNTDTSDLDYFQTEEITKIDAASQENLQ